MSAIGRRWLGGTLIAWLLISTPMAHAEVIKIDGSSTVFPITEAVVEEFQKAQPGKVTVSLNLSSTGAGFRKFCRDETDIADASRPISAREMLACQAAGIEYLEMPVAFDALTVVVNPRNTFLKDLSVAQLKQMWAPAAQGRVLKWQQIHPNWPDEPFKLFGPGGESGTFEYFTEAIVGEARASRGDYTASGDANVLVQGVARDNNAIAYFGYAHYAENKGRLRALAIVNPTTGKAVEPTAANVENGSYAPLSRPIFIYVKARSLARPEVRAFVEFYMKNGAKLSREVKYVPLPPAAYAANLEHLASKRYGSVFGGHNEISFTIGELMQREKSSLPAPNKGQGKPR